MNEAIMKAPTGYVWVSLACNDDNGHFSGELFSIEIGDEITLETNPFEGVTISLFPNDDGAKNDKFKLGDETFEYVKTQPWLGSMTWTGVLMKEEDAHRLMTTAPKLGFTMFQYTTDSPYWKAFSQGEKDHEQARKGTLRGRENNDSA